MGNVAVILSSGAPRKTYAFISLKEINKTIILTIWTGFGIFNVRHSFGAQRPHSDSQLLRENKEKERRI